MHLIQIINVSIFSACVSCGLAILRNTKVDLLPYIYSGAFLTAYVFNLLNNITDTFIAGLCAGFTAAVFVGIFHRLGRHGYLFIVIPVIYCIGPGGAMYKLFLSVFNLQFGTLFSQLLFILKDAFGIRSGILLGTLVMNKITKQQSEKF